jgi:hypothetical protein
LEFWLLTIALPTSILFCKGAKLFSYSLLESTPRLWTIISANSFHDSFSPSSRIDGLLRNEIGKKMRMIHELIFGGPTSLHQNRLIRASLDIHKHQLPFIVMAPAPFHCYGSHVVKENIKCSYGYYSMTA